LLSLKIPNREHRPGKKHSNQQSANDANHSADPPGTQAQDSKYEGANWNHDRQDDGNEFGLIDVIGQAGVWDESNLVRHQLVNGIAPLKVALNRRLIIRRGLIHCPSLAQGTLSTC